MSRWSPKGDAILRECSGDHGAYTDHCMACAPYWRTCPICPRCERKAGETVHSGVVKCVNRECPSFGDRFNRPKED